MPHLALSCTRCDRRYAADMTNLHCRDCGSPLDVEYRGGPGATSNPQPPDWTGRGGPHVPLPLHDAASWVTLGEGDTPVVELPALGSRLGLEGVHAKLEFAGPTGSFKDRGAAVMLSVAKELGVAELVEDSSGNAGAAVAAYAARAGIRAHIFAPASAPEAKLSQIAVYGAETHLIEGPREAATEAAAAFCEHHALVYASHNLSPYFVEGTKLFAYEVAAQMSSAMPRHILFPVGNGSLLIGAWKGFTELADAGHIGDVPRLHCIQARAVMPIAAAFEGVTWASEPGAGTVAGGISVGSPPRMQQVLAALRATGGVATAVEDAAIVEWQGWLAEREGLYCEPTSAAAAAGLARLVAQGAVKGDETVLIPITGSGLKDRPPG